MIGRNRKISGAVASIGIVAVVVTAVGIAPSLASWTDAEYVNGDVGSLACGSTGTFNSTAWGQMIAGQVAGTPLDGHLAELLGVTTTSGHPNSTAVVGPGATATSLGNDAWSSNLQVGALDAIDLGAGLTVPLSQNTGADTQYARATSGGLAVGASGAITTGSGGAVQVGTPISTAPGVGSLSLANALSGTVGDELAGKTGELSNTSLAIGALGSTSTLDSCNAQWQGLSDAASVVRDYVISKLGLQFSSSLVGDTVTAADNTVNGLTATLNNLQPLGAVTDGSVTSALTNALSSSSGGAVTVSLGSPSSVKARVVFDPTPALTLLTSTITSGAVSINLGTGEIDADIAGLGGVDLNSLPANSKLIDSTTLAALTQDVKAAVDRFITVDLANAITATLDDANVEIDIDAVAHVAVATISPIPPINVDAADLSVTVNGSLGQFLDPTSNGQPTIALSTDALGVGTLLAGVGIDLTTLLGTVTSGLTSALTATILPAVATDVLAPVKSLANAAIGSALDALDLTAPLITSISGVVSVLGDALQLTVNDQPDAAGSVGSPETAAGGRFYESALHIGVLDTAGGSSTLGLFLGSSSVGPDSN
jgi:hypothetical protein